MIFNYWPGWFRALCGGEFPRSYCAIDCETTGFNHDIDVISEWGHCLVEDGKVVNRFDVVLNWTGREVPPDHWLRDRLQWLAQNMEKDGLSNHVSYERMQREGMEPIGILTFIHDFLTALLARHIPIVAHHIWFDEHALASNLAGFGIAQNFSFPDNGIFDTSGLEKASQVIDDQRMLPKLGDTLRSYFKRVRYAKIPGIKSNLDGHCARKYNFAAKGISAKDMHGAGTDAFCCHLLMEEYRRHLKDGPAPLPNNQTFVEDAHDTIEESPVQAKAATPDVRSRHPPVRCRGERNR